MDENLIEKMPQAYKCQYCWYRNHGGNGYHTDIRNPIDTYSPMVCAGCSLEVNAIGCMKIVDYVETKW